MVIVIYVPIMVQVASIHGYNRKFVKSTIKTVFVNKCSIKSYFEKLHELMCL